MKNTLKRIVAGLCGLCMVLTLEGGTALALDLGPLNTTNRLPIYLMFLMPRPTKARLPDPGEMETRLALEYSSVNLDHTGEQWEVLMDMEMAVLDLSLTFAANRKLALKLDAFLVSMGDGTLDRFLENYHDALGVPNYGREDRPQDTFGYKAIKDGRPWFEGRTGTWDPGDITLSAQIELASSPGADRLRTTSLLLSLKVPVGDDAVGLSSGAYDAGIFVPVQWSGSPWSFYLMPGFTFIGDPESRLADVSSRNSYSLFAGAAWAYSKRLSLLAQLQFLSSPLERTGSSKLDNGALEISFGFQQQLSREWAVELSFTEDLTQAAPDFNLRLGLVWATKGLSGQSISDR